MRALVLAALVAASPAFADQVVRNGGRELRLQDSSCSHGQTLSNIKPEWRDKFKNARLMKDGKIEFYGCWILAEDGLIFVLYEDGDHGEYPAALFSVEGT